MIYIGELLQSCRDYGFVSLLVIVKNILTILQIFAPILLMVSCIYGLIRMLINPEDKKGLISLRNKVFAAVLFFFLPLVISIVLNWTEDTFSISACWVEAEEYKAQLDSMEEYEITDLNSNKKPITYDIQQYQFNTNIKGNATGKEIVDYALSFVGKGYIYGGGHGFDGTLEELYASGSAPDCSAFTRLVYKKFGYELSGTSATQRNDGVAVSYEDAQAGDLILYNGHVAIFMGDGDKIVHAASTTEGVKISNNAKYKTIVAVRRII